MTPSEEVEASLWMEEMQSVLRLIQQDQLLYSKLRQRIEIMVNTLLELIQSTPPKGTTPALKSLIDELLNK